MHPESVTVELNYQSSSHSTSLPSDKLNMAHPDSTLPDEVFPNRPRTMFQFQLPRMIDPSDPENKVKANLRSDVDAIISRSAHLSQLLNLYDSESTPGHFQMCSNFDRSRVFTGSSYTVSVSRADREIHGIPHKLKEVPLKNFRNTKLCTMQKNAGVTFHLYMFCIVQDYNFQLKPYFPREWLSILSASANGAAKCYRCLKAFQAASKVEQENYEYYMSTRGLQEVSNGYPFSNKTQVVTHNDMPFNVGKIFLLCMTEVMTQIATCSPVSDGAVDAENQADVDEIMDRTIAEEYIQKPSKRWYGAYFSSLFGGVHQNNAPPSVFHFKKEAARMTKYWHFALFALKTKHAIFTQPSIVKCYDGVEDEDPENMKAAIVIHKEILSNRLATLFCDPENTPAEHVRMVQTHIDLGVTLQPLEKGVNFLLHGKRSKDFISDVLQKNPERQKEESASWFQQMMNGLRRSLMRHSDVPPTPPFPECHPSRKNTSLDPTCSFNPFCRFSKFLKDRFTGRQTDVWEPNVPVVSRVPEDISQRNGGTRKTSLDGLESREDASSRAFPGVPSTGSKSNSRSDGSASDPENTQERSQVQDPIPAPIIETEQLQLGEETCSQAENDLMELLEIHFPEYETVPGESRANTASGASNDESPYECNEFPLTSILRPTVSIYPSMWTSGEMGGAQSGKMPLVFHKDNEPEPHLRHLTTQDDSDEHITFLSAPGVRLEEKPGLSANHTKFVRVYNPSGRTQEQSTNTKNLPGMIWRAQQVATEMFLRDQETTEKENSFEYVRKVMEVVENSVRNSAFFSQTTDRQCVRIEQTISMPGHFDPCKFEFVLPDGTNRINTIFSVCNAGEHTNYITSRLKDVFVPLRDTFLRSYRSDLHKLSAAAKTRLMYCFESLIFHFGDQHKHRPVHKSVQPYCQSSKMPIQVYLARIKPITTRDHVATQMDHGYDPALLTWDCNNLANSNTESFFQTPHNKLVRSKLGDPNRKKVKYPVLFASCCSLAKMHLMRASGEWEITGESDVLPGFFEQADHKRLSTLEVNSEDADHLFTEIARLAVFCYKTTWREIVKNRLGIPVEETPFTVSEARQFSPRIRRKRGNIGSIRAGTITTAGRCADCCQRQLFFSQHTVKRFLL